MSPISDRLTAPAGASDLELLRTFEPVVYYTKGEQVYPAAVEPYIQECSLWEHLPDGTEQLLVPQGQMSMDKLVAPRPAAFGSIRYLRFIEALNLAEAAQVLANQAALRRRIGEYFRPGIGRLARGGFLPRLADGLFSLSFLLRGHLSAANMAAAELDYNAIHEEQPGYTYYGRVARQAGWTVLQYWFFYYSNPWRSGFHGVNDHESDWEMISLYLYEDNGQLIPEWAAFASHDFNGDDLRRRWDDRSQLTLENGHPVVFAGAGSHASYFRRGEYQDEVTLPVPDWLAGLLKAFNTLWTQTLGQAPVDAFRVPFVDYARADGLRIGPDGPNPWSPVLVDDTVPWVSQYHGLWGLFAKDPISGENAPAGPMYNRDGTPRGRWVDPLGFAGLDKLPPPPQARKMLEQDSQELSKRQAELDTLIPAKADSLQRLGMQLKGMEGNPYLARQHAALEKEIAKLSAELRDLRKESTENVAMLQGFTRQLERLRAGIQDDPHAHIKRLDTPDNPDEKLRFDRAAETWAAISLSLLLFVVGGLLFFASHYLWIGLAIVLIVFVVVESILRGAFVETVTWITLLLAMLASVILFIHFWKWIILAALLLMGISLLVQRLRELAG
ncbi:MAG TPA: hypothetical protein VMT91_00325 [Anaerolineales bacterium]|nr:hypothetical protein [Anaerolineales bacterium]